MRSKLRLAAAQHQLLQRHLLPGDGLEAVALAICGRRSGERDHVLTVRRIVPIPHNECERSRLKVSWKTEEQLLPLLDEAVKEDAAVLKIHSHPSGPRWFSALDDQADAALFPGIFGAATSDAPHASAIMLGDGSIVGRAQHASGKTEPLECVTVVGDEIVTWYPEERLDSVPEFARRHAQLFGAGTVQRLRRMAVAVVGCSGTGSIVVELLARLGVGRLVLVDPDRVEVKNLNRILNATREDAFLRRTKVESLARAIAATGFDSDVEIVPENLASRAAVLRVAECDVVFGCMDGAEGRYILNRVAAFYSLPYFDVGVRLEAENTGRGGIAEVSGSVHYLQPGGSSLVSRGAITMDQVTADGLRRTNPVLFRERVRAGYLRGIREERPAVITVNMHFACAAVNEFLARLHPYREYPASSAAWMQADLIEGETYREDDGPPCSALARHVGRGDIEPLLDRPELSAPAGT